jgi:hypothetical protein
LPACGNQRLKNFKAVEKSYPFLSLSSLFFSPSKQSGGGGGGISQSSDIFPSVRECRVKTTAIPFC